MSEAGDSDDALEQLAATVASGHDETQGATVTDGLSASKPRGTAGATGQQRTKTAAAAAADSGTSPRDRPDIVPVPAAVTAPELDRSTRYRMDHGRRGKFIVINNETFEPSANAPKRDGTDRDAEELRRTFTNLGFQVEIKKNATAEEMKQLIEKVAKEDHSDCDCFGLAVLTHGYRYDILYGTDATVTVDELVKPLKRCTTLYGKPKLCFFQACRGEKLDHGYAQKDGPVSYNCGAAEVAEGDEAKRIPREADFLYAYSTPPEHFAWRHNLNGSWFIQALCEQLEKHSRSLDLAHILTRVNDRVANDYAARCPGHPHLHGMKQVPSIVSMLTKDLYFY